MMQAFKDTPPFILSRRHARHLRSTLNLLRYDWELVFVGPYSLLEAAFLVCVSATFSIPRGWLLAIIIVK